MSGCSFLSARMKCRTANSSRNCMRFVTRPSFPSFLPRLLSSFLLSFIPPSPPSFLSLPPPLSHFLDPSLLPALLSLIPSLMRINLLNSSMIDLDGTSPTLEYCYLFTTVNILTDSYSCFCRFHPNHIPIAKGRAIVVMKREWRYYRLRWRRKTGCYWK